MATLVVTNHANGGPGSLRQAIEDAPSGAWIVFDDALPAGDILLASPLVIEKVLTIGGLDAMGNRHGIDGQSTHRIFSVDAGALQVNDMVLHHGSEATGGAIRVSFATAVLWRTHVHTCDATLFGGGVYVNEGSLEVYDGFFEMNGTSGQGAAIAARESSVRIERTSFFMNESQASGGALSVRGSNAVVVNASFHMNRTLFGGGGAVRAETVSGESPCSLGMYNCTVTENDAATVGGGVSVHGDPAVAASLEMHRSIVADNSAPANRDSAGSGAMSASGTRNIVGVGGGLFFHGIANNMVGDAVTPFDPELAAPGPIADGRVVSFPIPLGISVDAVPAGMNPNPEGAPMVVDLRFFPRFPAQPSDLGALEL